MAPRSTRIDLTALSDDVLMRRCGRGDTHALDELVRSVRSRALLAAVSLQTNRRESYATVPTGPVLAVVPDGDPAAIILARDSGHLDNRKVLTTWLADHLAGDGRTVGWPHPVEVEVPEASLLVELHAPLRLLSGSDAGERLAMPVVVRRSGEIRPVVVGLLDLALLAPAGAEDLAWWGMTFAEGELPAGFAAASQPPPQAGPFHATHLAAALVLLLAMMGAGLLVDGVLRDFVRKLAGLAEAMEALARGEDSQRLPATGHDEIARLEGWFNLMAASLEEAHGEVRTKAVDLNGTLENLRAHDRAKDDFLVLVSHEVRTPLTSILAGLEHLDATLKGADVADREAFARLRLHDIVEIVESSSQRLNGFLTDALQITAIQSGDQPLELDPVAPGELVAPCLERISTEAAARNITVVDELSGVTSWLALADARVMRLALGKLLDNAVRHNTDGGRVILRVVPAVPELGEPPALLRPQNMRRLESQRAYNQWADDDLSWRIIEVYNTGPVIPADRMSHLFGKFETVGPIEHHSHGSGLSLPIAKAAVEQHGGRIFAMSRQDVGTAFYLLVPALAPGVLPRDRSLWDDPPERVGRGTADEEIRQVTDAALGKIELDHGDAPVPGEGDEAGGGVDGPGGADHEEEPAPADCLL